MITDISPDAAAWQHDMAGFMYEPKEIDTTQQLAFMAALLGEFDQTVLSLNQAQLNRLSRNVEKNPSSWRVVPTVLGEVTDRMAIVQPLTDSPLTTLMGPHAKLWTPQDNSNRIYPEITKWHKLWSGSGKVVQEDALFISRDQRDKGVKPQVRPYVLRSKTPEGRMKSRPQYIAALLRNGDALRAEDGKVWTFPIMDVSSTSPDKDYKNPSELYKRLHYIVTPEARLGVQVMHLIAGNPLHQDVVEITNETLCELNSNGTLKEIRGVVGVTRSETGQFFRQSWWTILALPDWQLPEGTSGLQNAR